MKHWLQNSLSKLKGALFKTRKDSFEEVENVGTCHSKSSREGENIEINDEYFEDLHEHFIKADIGFDLSEKIITNLKKSLTGKIEKTKLIEKIKETIKALLSNESSAFIPNSAILNIFLIVGVNGSGKTTSIGKLAKRFKDNGLKVLIIAADTFRAAAQDQLFIWTERAQVEIHSPPNIKKPDAVVFSAIERAKKENYNLLLIDTAGRLHSQANLMDELKKINSVIEKNASDAVRENLIVLDATIGQNAITQAELFSKVTPLTGIVLAKLDSSAKGGVILNIMNKLSLSVKLIGTGEKIDDLVEFNLDEYLDGLLM